MLTVGQYRYKEFTRAVREFRHLRSVKRAGRGHTDGGVDETSQGELVVHCPMSPFKGRNLPPDFNDLPEDQR